MRTLQKTVLAMVLALVVVHVAMAAERSRGTQRNFTIKNDHKFQTNRITLPNTHKLQTFNLTLHNNATRVWSGKKDYLTSTYRGNDYHVKFAKKFDFGYVYYGKVHNHWEHKYYSPVNQVYFYWCPCSKCYYWYCPEQECYYPYGYTPAGYTKTFTW